MLKQPVALDVKYKNKSKQNRSVSYLSHLKSLHRQMYRSTKGERSCFSWITSASEAIDAHA